MSQRAVNGLFVVEKPTICGVRRATVDRGGSKLEHVRVVRGRLTLAAERAGEDATVKLCLPAFPAGGTELVTADSRRKRASHELLQTDRATVARIVRERVLQHLDIVEGAHTHLVAEPVPRRLVDRAHEVGDRLVGRHGALERADGISELRHVLEVRTHLVDGWVLQERVGIGVQRRRVCRRVERAVG